MPFFVGAQNTTTQIGFLGSEKSRPAEKASDIISANSNAPDGLYWIKPSGYSGAPFQVYCILASSTHNSVTDPGGWMHVGTVSDTPQHGTNEPKFSEWAYYIHRSEDGSYNSADNRGGRWTDTVPIGVQSFNNNFKNQPAWSNIPMTQLMICDQGDQLRRILYTSAISQVSSTRHFFGGSNPGTTNIHLHDHQRNRNHSTSSRADSSGGIAFRNLSVTSFSRNDDVFQNCSRLLVMFTESNDMDTGNNDRSVLTPYGSSQGISLTQGLGASRQDGNSTAFRNVDNQFRDQPGSISKFYNYTLWVK